jgi:hypothetical protein
MHGLDIIDPVNMNVEEISFEIMGWVELSQCGLN